MMGRLQALLARLAGRKTASGPQVLIEMGAAWGEMSAKERREFLRQLAASGDLPGGCSVEVSE